MDDIEMLRKIDPAEIVANLREGVLVLNSDLEVVFGNQSFFDQFEVEQAATVGRKLAALGDGQWDIPALHDLLRRVLEHGETIENYEVDHAFEHIGRRVMRLNARKVRPASDLVADTDPALLLAIEDVTKLVELDRQLAQQRRISQGVVDTLREPLLVLNSGLEVMAASRSFYRTFEVSAEQTIGRPLSELGNGQWRIPALLDLLTNVIPDNSSVEDFEVDHDFETIGCKVILLNARKLYRPGNDSRTILLAMQDMTDHRRLEAEREAALQRANRLLLELNHRVMNSLSMIGAVIALEGRSLNDDACRAAFDRMRARIEAVASLYRSLSLAGSIDTVDAHEYLSTLFRGVVESARRAELDLDIDLSGVSEPLSTRLAVPLGLIINELVTNSVKYAFTGRTNGVLGMAMSVNDGMMDLVVWDDGVGIDHSARVDSGLGQKLTEAFSRQIQGELTRESGEKGTRHRLRFPLQGEFVDTPDPE